MKSSQVKDFVHKATFVNIIFLLSSLLIRGMRAKLFVCILRKEKENKADWKEEQKYLCFNSLSRCVSFLHI